VTERPEQGGTTRRGALSVGRTAMGGAGLLALTPGAASAAPAPAGGIFALPSTRAAMPVPRDAPALRTGGFAAAADGGGALYRRVASAPAHRGWFRSSDGAYWEMAEDAPSIRAFGAIGDAQADDRAAIQAAIDFVADRGGGSVTIPAGRFRLVTVTAPDGTGPIALWMRSGVRLQGSDRARSVLLLADAQRGPGTFGRIIASGVLLDAALADFTLEANRAGQGAERDATNGAAIMLGTAGAHVERVVIERLVVRGANGQGIQVVGHPKAISRDVTIRGNRVEGSSFIGIQVSHFTDLTIDDNDISDCRDNGIDVYGDNFTNNSTTPTSTQARITRNRVRRCSSGVFLETVADIDVTQNVFDGCRTMGLHVNRIHGEPSGIMVTNNRVTRTPIGMSITGDTGGVSFQGNHFSHFSRAALQFGLEGQGNVSFITATGNVFDCRHVTCPVVLGDSPKGVLSWVRIVDNIVLGLPKPEQLFVNRFATNNVVRVGSFIGVQSDLPA
jgi:hypothetical protein